MRVTSRGHSLHAATDALTTARQAVLHLESATSSSHALHSAHVRLLACTPHPCLRTLALACCCRRSCSAPAAAAAAGAALQDSAEFGKIGRYYAAESMLVWDEKRGVYDADATPSYGTDTLEGFFQKALTEGLKGQELGDQAVFGVGE